MTDVMVILQSDSRANNIYGVTGYLIGGPSSFVSFPCRRARRAKFEGGTARALLRGYLRFPIVAPYQGCSIAGALGERRGGAARRRKNCSRARRRQNRGSRWLPPCPCHGLAVRRRAICSSNRCRGLLGEGTAKRRTGTRQSGAVKARVGRGNRSVPRRARRR